MGQKLQISLVLQGRSGTKTEVKDAKFRRLTEAEAEQKVKSYQLALEQTSANEVTTGKLRNAAILRTSAFQDKPGYKAENEQLYPSLDLYAFLQPRVLDS